MPATRPGWTMALSVDLDANPARRPAVVENLTPEEEQLAREAEA